MDLLQESTFNRLLARYERAFGEPPPFDVATPDDAIAFMRQRLWSQADVPRGTERTKAGSIEYQPALLLRSGTAAIRPATAA